MCFANKSKQNRAGFLLMESLLAIVLFSSFGIVVGMYWQHLLSQQKKVEMQLQALSCATDIVDAIIAGQSDFQHLKKTTKNYTTSIEKKMINPYLLKGSLKNLDKVQLVEISVGSYKEQVQLQTLIAGLHD